MSYRHMGGGMGCIETYSAAVIVDLIYTRARTCSGQDENELHFHGNNIFRFYPIYRIVCSSQ